LLLVVGPRDVDLGEDPLSAVLDLGLILHCKVRVFLLDHVDLALELVGVDEVHDLVVFLAELARVEEIP